MARVVQSVTDLASALRPLASFAWRMLLTLTICRSVFVLYDWQAVRGAGALGAVYSAGLESDVALVLLVLLVPVLSFPVLASNRRLVNAWRGLFTACLPFVLLTIVLVQCATPSFVDPLDGRPALIFFEYLNDPAGVAAALWAGFRTPIVVAAVLALIAAWTSARRLAVIAGRVRPVGLMPALVAMPVLLTGCFLAFGLIADRVVADARRTETDTPQAVAVAAYNEKLPETFDPGR
jgi:hypothetical protein